ncbi:uncharacterized protein LOC121866319 [Homarus americanus]|uniref:uncharacterized protein LOC121866319 n=1 Tax=Homarus americanus TaxID=6706 RepID=UPI001C471540|nr:uncharacterized protein LOC121866319 [Homarus americanus]
MRLPLTLSLNPWTNQQPHIVNRRQQPGEFLDKFLQELRKLSKDCNLKAVAAEQYREQLIRDSFINVIASPLIRQRLLGNKTLDFQSGYNQTYTLDLAQNNYDAYASPIGHTAAIPAAEPTQEADVIAQEKMQ